MIEAVGKPSRRWPGPCAQAVTAAMLCQGVVPFDPIGSIALPNGVVTIDIGAEDLRILAVYQVLRPPDCLTLPRSPLACWIIPMTGPGISAVGMEPSRHEETDRSLRSARFKGVRWPNLAREQRRRRRSERIGFGCGEPMPTVRQRLPRSYEITTCGPESEVDGLASATQRNRVEHEMSRIKRSADPRSLGNRSFVQCCPSSLVK